MPNQPLKKSLRLKIAFIIGLVSFLSLIFYNFLDNKLLTSLLIVFSGAGGIFLSFVFLKPLEKLFFTLKVISSGNIGTKAEIHSNDELGDISTALNQMMLSVKQVVDKVEEEKGILSSQTSKLNLILSSITDGIIAVDLHKNVLFANTAAQKITGFTLQEMINRPVDQFMKVFSKREEIMAKNYCPLSFSDQPSSPFTSDQSLKLIGKDSKQTDIILSGLPITGNLQSNLGCILVIHDLTKESELEQMKLDFVSMASHELRTPLTSIIGYLKVFIDENRQKITKEELELLEKSLASAQRLYTLVINLLNVNKIERQRLVISPEPIDWSATLTKAVEDLQNQAKQKSIILSLTLPATPLPKVMADTTRITEVVNNLVSNAVNYTKSGGKVTVYTQTTPNEVITTIEDTGMGIPKEAIPRLFNKFFRAASTLDPNYKQGTGLGLYISKSIIDNLKGKIWVESEIGTGSKFHFSLPIATTSDSLQQKGALEMRMQNYLNPPVVH
ncbi:PAS domain S-box protein [Candidatus Daviesbacteria bacterium]|nr:PAS domain S-box protein [Candidatus Daviesbacteria bacterium]